MAETNPAREAAQSLFALFDYVPDDFRHNGQTLHQRIEAWVAHVLEQIDQEVEGYGRS